MIETRDALRSILEVLKGSSVLQRNEVIDRVADHMGIDELEREIRLPSESAYRYRHRIGWALTYLSKAKFVERPRQGHYQMAPAGTSACESTESDRR